MIELILKGNADSDKIVDYLAQRCEIDECLKEACQKENKTLAGVMKYIENQVLETIDKKERKGQVMRMIDDDTVYEWAVHYILEDSLDCEPKSEKKPKDYLAEWKATHPTPSAPVTPPKAKSEVERSGQLVFDF